MALQARLMGRGLRAIVNANNNVELEDAVTLIFLNQVRSKVGVIFGNPEVRPGGKALPFFAFVVLEVRPGAKIEDGNGNIIGHKVRIKNPKNKIASPHHYVDLDLIYGKGFCTFGSLLDAALSMDVVTQNGTYYSLKDDRLGHGRAKAVDRLRNDPVLAKKIEELTREEFARRCQWDDAQVTPSGNKPPSLSVHGNGGDKDSATGELPISEDIPA